MPELPRVLKITGYRESEPESTESSMRTPKDRLLNLAAEAEILGLQLARCEDMKFRKGGAIAYLLYKCSYQDRGMAYNGSLRLPSALSLAVRSLDEANTFSAMSGDYGVLASACVGLARVIRTGLGVTA